MKKYIYILFISISIFFTQTSCFIFKKQDPADKQMKVLEKKQRQKEKEELKIYRQAIKKHMKMQSKNTRKMMKRGYGTADRTNDNKREFFLKRWLQSGLKKKRSNSGK
ncbi:MAG: hypothetical protein WCK02_02925 [Bacteroidota bacterium]